MTQTKTSRIPKFATIEEEARFWDTHDTVDFEDEFTPVKVRFAKSLSTGITIRFDHQILTRLRSKARAKGIGPTTLIRMWVLERLQRASPNSQQAGP